MNSNLAVLTNSHRIIAAKRRAKRDQVKEVVFDDQARREFLTGFHKRKLQKKEAAKKKAEEREKQERLETRREKRQILAEKAAQNAKEVEQAYGAQLSDDDEEWEGLEGSKGKGKGKADEIEEEYEDEEQLATVTVVEDFDPVELLHGPSRTPHEDKDVDGDEKMDVIPSAPPRQKNPKVVETKKARSRATTKAKDIKYQTNSARKVERAKQTRRKNEKAERAGGKGMRKGKGVRGRR